MATKQTAREIGQQYDEGLINLKECVSRIEALPRHRCGTCLYFNSVASKCRAPVPSWTQQLVVFCAASGDQAHVTEQYGLCCPCWVNFDDPPER